MRHGFWTIFALSLLLSAGSASAANDCTVTVPWPGQSPSFVDSNVAQVLAHRLGRLVGLEAMEIESRRGRCTAILRFSPRVQFEQAFLDTQAELNAVIGLLPADCQVPLIQRGDQTKFPQFWLAVRGDRLALADTTNVAEQSVAQKLAQITGVSAVRIIGAGHSVPTIVLDSRKLASFGLTAQEVSTAVAAAHKTPEGAPAKPLLETAALGETVVGMANGAVVRLRDVGEVKNAARAEGFATVDNHPAVLVAVSVQPSGPTTATLEKELATIRAALPPGVSVELAADLSRNASPFVEVALPPDTSAAKARSAAEQIATAIRAATQRGCLAFSTGNGDPIEVLVSRGDRTLAASELSKPLAALNVGAARVGEVGGMSLLPFPVRIALAGPDRAILKRWEDAVLKRIAGEETVAFPAAFADDDVPGMHVEIDRHRAAELGVTMQQLSQAVDLSFGETMTVQVGAANVELRLGGGHNRAEMMANTFVRSTEGRMIPLAQLARISTINEPTGFLRIGWEPAVRLTASPLRSETPAAAAAKCLAIAIEEAKKLQLSPEYRAIDLVVSK